MIMFAVISGQRMYLTDRARPENISQQFQNEIRATETDLKNQLANVAANFDTNVLNGAGVKFNFFHDKDGDGEFSYFIYSGDSLVFWSNNKVILPEEFSKTFRSGHYALRLKNGWYGFQGVRSGLYHFVGCYLIKSEFSFQNEYIKSRFSSRFDLPPSVSVSLAPGGPNPVYAADGTRLFGLQFDGNMPESGKQSGMFLLLFLLGSLSLCYFLWHVFSGIAWFRSRENLMVVFYFSTICLLRLLQYSIGFPGEMYQSELFSPALYSSSSLLPSLGDFTINALMLTLISLVFYKRSSLNPFRLARGHALQTAAAFMALFILLVLFHSIRYLVTDLVINSPVSLNLQNISGLTYESSFGLFIIAALLVSWWLISIKVLDFIVACVTSGKLLVLFAVIVSCLYSLLFVLSGWQPNITITLFFLFYVFSYRYFKEKNRALFSVQSLLFLLVFYPAFTTFLLNGANHTKETEKRNLLAVKLMTRRNPVTEVLYEQVERKLDADSLLKQWADPGFTGRRVSNDSLAVYLKTQYFKDYWKKYQIQVTCCEPGKELRIQPQGYLVTCASYFHDIIRNYGESTVCTNLFFLDYGLGKEYYLAVFSREPFSAKSFTRAAIIIEFNLKNAYPDPGYPGLLMDKTRFDLPNLSDYSYALYQNGLLVRAAGACGYKTDLGKYAMFDAARPGFTDDHMVHFQYKISGNNRLVISKKEDDYLAFAAPFSYLFILFSIVILMVGGIINFPKNITHVPATLRNRLHFALIGTLVFAMLAIGIMQAVTIIRINAKKNVDNLRERAASMVVEVRHKYGNLQQIREVSKGDLEDFLVKLSNIFFADINVYDAKGVLVASSRPQVFEEGLLSERMNSEAFSKLVLDKNSIYIHDESIGSMQFNSAYLPIYSEQDQLLGFVNLPYFAKQDESKKEISSFLVTFLNVYILLILFSVFVTILISNYITSPLSMLARKMSQVRLGMVNEKITWAPGDEIGKLVAEYNRMIDELATSAEKLGRSERESAWREMARQVAHEIKNPLTPMKLSVQYLEKAWNEKAPDWDLRLARFTRILVEQIDTLSVIASDFSDFAKMPAIVSEKTDMEEVIRYVLTMYQDTSSIRYEFIPGEKPAEILADRSQLIRVFTNLLNNAVQAIGESDEGLIRIDLTRERQQIIIMVSDNGSGIPAGLRNKIFQPEFTTKTSGMGLGLAIVRGIVEGMNGEISFSSEDKKGTTFIIKFPIYDERS